MGSQRPYGHAAKGRGAMVMVKAVVKRAYNECVFNYLRTFYVGLCAVISQEEIGIVHDIEQPHNQSRHCAGWVPIPDK